MMQARRTSGNMDEAIGTFGAPPAGTQLLPCPEGVSIAYEYSPRNFHEGRFNMAAITYEGT